MPHVRKAVATLKLVRRRTVVGGNAVSHMRIRSQVKGKGTPSQTAWVIMALWLQGRGCERYDEGYASSLKSKSRDGTWDET